MREMVALADELVVRLMGGACEADHPLLFGQQPHVLIPKPTQLQAL